MRTTVAVSLILLAAFTTGSNAKTGVIHACNAKFESMATRELVNLTTRALADASVNHTEADVAAIAGNAAPQLRAIRTQSFSVTACNANGQTCVAFVCE